jgi:hypothetical protein
MIVLEENRARGEHAATQADRPPLQKDPSPSSVWVLKFVCPEPP